MAIGLFILASIALIGWWLSEPWRTARRRAKILASPFPSHWRRILKRKVPLTRNLPADLQLKLKKNIQLFLAEKPIIGCQGLAITDTMRLMIAAQACLLSLQKPNDNFPNLRQILVYPSAFNAHHPNTDPAHHPGELQHHDTPTLSGESWSEGQVLLSWEDVQHGSLDPQDGFNVVIHEFAHQLDQEKGYANGAPWLGPRKERYERWAKIMQQEFIRLNQALSQEQPTLIDPYGATDPAEFFAVISELFFERPQDLQEQHPELYQELRDFYKLNPAGW